MKQFLLLFVLCSACAASLFSGSNPPHPEGLLLRGFESEGAANRRGDEAVQSGVLTTVRVDAAGEVSSTQSAAELAPLVEWYQDRGQYYSGYADFAPGVGSALGFQEDISSAGKTLNLDGDLSNPSIFLEETYDAIVAVAKAYVDAGVDAIHYDTAWVTLDAGPFDSAAMTDFRTWLNSNYSEVTLQSYVDASYDASTFDYGSFLRSEGVTATNYDTATIDGVALGSTKHWRLWQAFIRSKEREAVSALVNEVNTYALSELGREVGFYFNRYGFINRPADRWFLAEYTSGDLGETLFAGQDWDFHEGYSLEPVLRAGLKTYDNRYEPWNSPPIAYTAVQSVFLAETLANNGVGTWEDDYPDTQSVARLARRYAAQLDHTPVSEAAIFYPLATVLHTETLQVGPDPGLLGGDHYWYLGLGYILQELNINYDVAFAGDGLGMPDTFDASDLSDYEVVFVSEAIQITDSQFTEVLDYVNAGGTLLVTGTNVFRYDALGEDKSSTRSYGSNSWSDLFGSAGTTTVGSGEVKVLSLDPWGSTGYSGQPSSAGLTTALSGISAALPSSIPAVSSGASGEVRALRYLDESDNSEVYHLVNYTFNGTGSSVTTQTSFTLDFPTPSSYAGTPVASYASSADSDPVTLTITDLGGGVSRVTIPSVSYWGILRVGSAMDATAHPNIEPIAYFDKLFDYEVFGSEASRALTYTAVDDEEVSQIQVYYSKKNTGDGTWGSWTAGDITAGDGSNALIDESLSVTLPEEGHFRLQLVATDGEGDSNALITASFDTEVGYDTTAMDRSGLTVTPVHGTLDGAVITSPVTPSFTVTGYEDPISGYGQYNYTWNNGGNTIAGGGDPLTETLTFNSLPAIVDGEYGTYSLVLRLQNGAEIWDDSAEVYSLIYTLPPTYNGAAENESLDSGGSVTFSLDYTSVYGDVSIQWYKDDSLMDGETGSQIDLSNVSDSDEGTYHAVITNPAGSITSEDFTLTVITPLEITAQPTGSSINAGESFSVTVEAQGEGALSYQWMLDNVDISGATGQTYTVNEADRVSHQGPYRVRITDSLTSVTSNSAFVTVNDQPGGGGGGGSGGTPNQPLNLSATDTGTAVNLSWEDNATNETGYAIERRESGSSTWTSVATRPADSTSFTDATDIGSLTYEYRIKATGSSGDSNYSNVAAVSRSSGGDFPGPTSLSASDNTEHVRLTWTDNASDETGYTIERKLSSDSTWAVAYEIGPNAQAFTDPINIGSNAYDYRVKAVRSSESSDYSNVASVSRSGGGGGGGGSDPAPTAPASLSATDAGDSVDLAWDDLSDNETGFAIERKKQGDSSWTSVANIGPNATSFNDATDIGSDTYEYRVKANGSSQDSNYSNVASVSRSGGGGGGGSDPAPTAPASLSATDAGDSVDLAWDDLSDNETGFAIERKKQGDSSWTSVASIGPNATSFSDATDIGSDTYEYRVKANGSSQDSNYSNVASVSRSGGGGGGGGSDPAPTAPASLSATDAGDSVDLAWDDLSDDETGFAIERKKQGDSSWTSVANIGPNATSFTDATDIGSDTYEYRVKASGSSQDSNYSNVASVSRSGGGGGGGSDPAPTAPASLSATDAGDSVDLAWDDLSNDETGFLVQRRIAESGTWEDLGETPANVSSYSDLSVEAATSYEYRVATQRGLELSEFSNVALITRNSGGGSEEINLSVIVSGIWSISGPIDPSKTIQELRNLIAEESGLQESELELYLGSTLLSSNSISISEAGIVEYDQLTAVSSTTEDDHSYASWQLEKFGNATENRLPVEDFDSDGIVNVLHYAIGTDPTIKSYANGLDIQLTSDQIVVTYLTRTEAIEGDLSLEFYTDEGGPWVTPESLELTRTTAPIEESGQTRITWTYEGSLEGLVLARLRLDPPTSE